MDRENEASGAWKNGDVRPVKGEKSIWEGRDKSFSNPNVIKYGVLNSI